MSKIKEINFFGGKETTVEIAKSVGKGLMFVGAAIVAPSAIQAATGAFNKK
ncbi:hypothetical protein M0R04_08955 [Candidatus Dojkabacteria bacterium]|jgi:hypothetical protein|nr:hypothetical protein [Candidatus Dojkabacteria bacterium]